MDNEKLARTIATIEEEISLGEYWEEIDRSIYMTTLYDILELLKGKTGKWERHYSRPGVYADLFWWCSCCGEPTRYNDAGIFYQHCPHCGAKLEPCKED